MKHIITAVFILGISGIASAGEKVDTSLNMPADGSVTIEDTNGEITIHGWDKEKVQVKGELADKANRYVFERDGDEVVFRVEYEKKGSFRDWFKGQDSSKLTFYVPVDSRIHTTIINGSVEANNVKGGTKLSSINGDIKGTSLEDRVSMQTVNGDVKAVKLAGKIRLETVNGDIRDEDSSGEITYVTVHGDIKAKSKATEIDLEAVNGDVELRLGRIDELSIELVNGDVKVYLDLDRKGEVSVESVNGDVALYFNKDVSADFSIQSHVSGDISNSLTDDKVQHSKFGLGQHLHFTKNGGSGDVDISTVSGRIVLGRQ